MEDKHPKTIFILKAENINLQIEQQSEIGMYVFILLEKNTMFIRINSSIFRNENWRSH